jgi:hypothetical protein
MIRFYTRTQGTCSIYPDSVRQHPVTINSAPGQTVSPLSCSHSLLLFFPQLSPSLSLSLSFFPPPNPPPPLFRCLCLSLSHSLPRYLSPPSLPPCLSATACVEWPFASRCSFHGSPGANENQAQKQRRYSLKLRRQILRNKEMEKDACGRVRAMSAPCLQSS